MKILLVCDQFDNANNGTTISAKRFAETLSAHGNEIRVISTGDPREGKYVVQEWRVPIFDKLIKSQGMAFGRPEKNVLQEAISWADVVHFTMPFALSIEGRKVAEELGVPHTAAFHVQPENITSSVHLGNASMVNEAIYAGFRTIFYNKFTHIHCPSNFIAEQLRSHGYTARLHVISNGISEAFQYRKEEKPAQWKDRIVLTMIGRLTREKRQDVVMDAALLSKYRDRIQLVFAGHGPLLEAYQKQGERLPFAPVMRFFTQEELLRLLAFSDLYLHAADVEIEAIACIEAFASGLVPVIADSPKSATPQFALDERSLFAAGDPAALAARIDYWLDHEEERRRMEKIYAEQADKYRIDACVYQIEEMFRMAMDEQRR